MLAPSPSPSPSKTVSTCTPATAQGTHVFDIFGYSQHKAIIGVRKRKTLVESSISSGVFSVGGHRWVIHVVPQMVSPNSSREFVAVVVQCLMSKNTELSASIDLWLLDRSNGSPSSSMRMNKTMLITPKHPGSRFISMRREASELETSGCLLDDRLTIQCTVTVAEESLVSPTRPFPEIEPPPSDIGEHFGKLLEVDGNGADVAFSVGGQTFYAHRVVLAARSPVFRAELYGPMKEAREQRVAIQDMHPAVFRALLHFIYTDSLPEMDDLEVDDDGGDEMARRLLVAADRYAMDRLKLMCQSIICRNLSVENVAAALGLADQHSCGRLKDACLEFIISSNMMDAVVTTKGYRNLKRARPSVIAEAWEKISRFRKA